MRHLWCWLVWDRVYYWRPVQTVRRWRGLADPEIVASFVPPGGDRRLFIADAAFHATPEARERVREALRRVADAEGHVE